MTKKDLIKNALREAKFMAKPEDMDKLLPKLGKDDLVKLVDEEQDITEDDERTNRAIEYGGDDGEITDNDWEELHRHMNEDDSINNTINTSKLKSDVAKFIDKLNLQQFESILSKIDKPQEQAEIIAAFAERIGVPRVKLPMVLATIKDISENVNPKITKDKLIEYITKQK